MLPQIKKKFVSAALGLAISIPTVAVFTSIDQKPANAQWRPNNPGVFACNSYANNNCLIYKSSVSTWVGSFASNECKRRHGQSALAQRTFIPYIFACLAPSDYV